MNQGSMMRSNWLHSSIPVIVDEKGPMQGSIPTRLPRSRKRHLSAISMMALDDYFPWSKSIREKLGGKRSMPSPLIDQERTTQHRPHQRP